MLLPCSGRPGPVLQESDHAFYSTVVACMYSINAEKIELRAPCSLFRPESRVPSASERHNVNHAIHGNLFSGGTVAVEVELHVLQIPSASHA